MYDGQLVRHTLTFIAAPPIPGQRALTTMAGNHRFVFTSNGITQTHEAHFCSLA